MDPTWLDVFEVPDSRGRLCRYRDGSGLTMCEGCDASLLPPPHPDPLGAC